MVRQRLWCGGDDEFPFSLSSVQEMKHHSNAHRKKETSFLLLFLFFLLLKTISFVCLEGEKVEVVVLCGSRGGGSGNGRSASIASEGQQQQQ